jgi:carbamoyltransferase
MNILGINAYHGDVAAVLLRDGQLVAAVEEERFRRIKHVAGFPRQAIQVCLEMGGITGRDVHHVAVSRRPRAHLLRKILFAARRRPDRRLIADRAANHRLVEGLGETVADALGLGPGDGRPQVHWV